MTTDITEKGLETLIMLYMTDRRIRDATDMVFTITNEPFPKTA